MIQPRTIKLFFQPERVNVAGQIVTLTPEKIDSKIHGNWWKHDDLKEQFDSPPPIDRNWRWDNIDIEYEGAILESEKVAIVAGEGDPVQGAMLISSDPIASVLERGAKGLFVERLFTAPWNRPRLRRDGQPYLLGIGTELMTWAVWFSRYKGYDGRLLLDGSPEELGWYLKRGLRSLDSNPILYEGTIYTPMELVPEAAQRLIEKWDAI